MLTKNPSFTYEVIDYNDIAQNSAFLNKLQELTLAPWSGMNNELRQMSSLVQNRKVKMKVIVARTIAINDPIKSIVGWALLSAEDSHYQFATGSQFSKEKGKLFQVYVKESYRRLGIASDLIKVAKRRCGKDKICFCPWDYQSRTFFANFSKYKHLKM